MLGLVESSWEDRPMYGVTLVFIPLNCAYNVPRVLIMKDLASVRRVMKPWSPPLDWVEGRRVICDCGKGLSDVGC